MQILFRILIFIFILYLAKLLLAVLMKSSKKAGAGSSSQDEGNHMVKDPVCGMYMDRRLAIRLDSRDQSVFFCSEECKKKYTNKSAGEGMDTAAAG